MTNSKNTSLRVKEQQLWFPITLPIVQGNKDYQDHKELLENIHHLLDVSGIESRLQEQELQKALVLAGGHLTVKDRARIQLWTSRALRCNVIRLLSGESFRRLAFRLGESPLLQNFCHLVEFDRARIPGKSTLQAFSELFDEKQIRDIISALNLSAQKGSFKSCKKTGSFNCALGQHMP